MTANGVYFAYGTSMWLDEIHRVCSDLKRIGFAQLHGWKWIVSDRGSATIIQSSNDIVYGLLYELHNADEAALDQWETPTYTKTQIEVEIMGISAAHLLKSRLRVFTYVDAEFTTEGVSKEEHTGRMNKAIAEGTRQGIPVEYFNKYVRPYIPKDWKPELSFERSESQLVSNRAAESANTLYFGYGSNIWLDQMKRRCPDNRFMGVGKLVEWKWIINTRGYANIIPAVADLVYGFVFELTPQDEKELDTFEGSGYKKVYLPVDLVKAKDHYATGQRPALVYVDVERLGEGISKKEYVYRINMAINDGLEEGIPQDYVDKYLRPFIPPLPNDSAPILAPE